MKAADYTTTRFKRELQQVSCPAFVTTYYTTTRFKRELQPKLVAGTSYVDYTTTRFKRELQLLFSERENGFILYHNEIQKGATTYILKGIFGT